jgi:MFS family permease
MFNYGAIAPVFFLYLTELSFSEQAIGALLTAILLGDLVITLYLSTRADGFGRRPTLVIASLLKVLAGVAFATTSNFWGLAVAGVVGVISTSGGEIGPFMGVEQALLTDALAAARSAPVTREEESAAVAVTIGWYTFCGYIAQALGALASGLAVSLLGGAGYSRLFAYQCVFFSYGVVGGVLAALYALLSPACEAKKKAGGGAGGGGGDGPPSVCPASLAPYLPAVTLGLRRAESRHIVARLSALFAMDAFAGAFVMQTWIAFWFATRWGFESATLGCLLMGANVVAGASGIAAAHFVKRFGAMLTMVATHLPSNVLLLTVPLMPSGPAAAAMLVARFSISQMDVPARQAYVQMVVASDERSAAGGITNLVRSLGMSLAPLLLGYLSSARPATGWLFSAPWVISGALKITYDLLLYGLYLSDNTMRHGEANAARADKAEAAAAEAEAGKDKRAQQHEPLLGAAERGDAAEEKGAR